MAAATKVLLAAVLARAASADCQSTYDSWWNSLGTNDPCGAANSTTCPSTCVPAFQALIDACEGQNLTYALGVNATFDKATVLTGTGLAEGPCLEPLVDLVLADPKDCVDPAKLVATGASLFCPTDEANPPAECAAICVKAMDAAYQRCESTDTYAWALLDGSRQLMSEACQAYMDTCSYGTGCSSTTTGPPISGSLRRRAAALPLLAASPLVLLLAA